LFDDFTGAQDAWISDGLFSLHKLVISDSDTSEDESDQSCNEGKIIHSSG